MSIQLKTSAEVAELKTPAPTPSPEPSIAARYNLPPPCECVDIQMTINGNNREHAVHQVQCAYDAKMEVLRQVHPDRAKQIAADLAGLDEMVSDYFLGIREAFTVIQSLETEIVQEAVLRDDLRLAEARLAAAFAPFADGSSANLDGGELLRLEQQKTHLPKHIEKLRRDIADAAKRISELLRCGADEKLIRSRIVREAKSDEGRVVNQRVWDLRDYILNP